MLISITSQNGDFMIYEFENKRPKIGANSYISKSAEVIGDVVIGDGCFIAPGAKIKGDYGSIRIGNMTSIQENCVIHARPGKICNIGNYVTAGHGCILHTCIIKDYAVIGMGAIISDDAVVGEWCAIGEGCVVKQNQEIPDNKIAVGVPAKIIGDVNEDYKKQWTEFKDIYVELAKRYPAGLKEIE